MSTVLITQEDLQQFKNELLSDIKSILDQNIPEQRQWLRSKEVKKLLSLSPGTLQNLRINGTLPYTKIGGVIYYEYADIIKMIEDNKFGGQE